MLLDLRRGLAYKVTLGIVYTIFLENFNYFPVLDKFRNRLYPHAPCYICYRFDEDMVALCFMQVLYKGAVYFDIVYLHLFQIFKRSKANPKIIQGKTAPD